MNKLTNEKIMFNAFKVVAFTIVAILLGCATVIASLIFPPRRPAQVGDIHKIV